MNVLEKPVTYLFDNKLTYDAATDKSVTWAPNCTLNPWRETESPQISLTALTFHVI